MTIIWAILTYFTTNEPDDDVEDDIYLGLCNFFKFTVDWFNYFLNFWKIRINFPEEISKINLFGRNFQTHQ